MTSPIDTTEEPTILKCDGLGCVRMPVDRREALLDEFEKSGLSALHPPVPKPNYPSRKRVFTPTKYSK